MEHLHNNDIASRCQNLYKHVGARKVADIKNDHSACFQLCYYHVCRCYHILLHIHHVFSCVIITCAVVITFCYTFIMFSVVLLSRVPLLSHFVTHSSCFQLCYYHVCRCYHICYTFSMFSVVLLSRVPLLSHLLHIQHVFSCVIITCAVVITFVTHSSCFQLCYYHVCRCYHICYTFSMFSVVLLSRVPLLSHLLHIHHVFSCVIITCAVVITFVTHSACFQLCYYHVCRCYHICYTFSMFSVVLLSRVPLLSHLLHIQHVFALTCSNIMLLIQSIGHITLVAITDTYILVPYFHQPFGSLTSLSLIEIMVWCRTVTLPQQILLSVWSQEQTSGKCEPKCKMQWRLFWVFSTSHCIRFSLSVNYSAKWQPFICPQTPTRPKILL